MKIPKKIFKAYDIRGIYPNDINEENIVDVTRGIYSFFVRDVKKKKLTVVLGRDMRLSSPSLSDKVRETLTKQGATVVDIGLATTPTVYFAVHHYHYDVGIQISASHNPKEYAGLKFFKRDGESLAKISKVYGMAKVAAIVEEKNFIDYQEGGEIIKKEGVIKDELNFNLKLLPLCDLKKIKIVIDVANAMGALTMEALSKKLSFSLIKMNFDLDGSFPSHDANPLKFYLWRDLEEKVVQEKADLGISLDGDADRVMFYDEKGKIIPPTLITCLVADSIFRKNNSKKIIVDIRYIKNVEAVCNKYNTKPILSIVGHALITASLNKEKAEFAGESSGHYYYRDFGGGESSILTILHVLKAINDKKRPISEIVNQYRAVVESGEVNFELIGSSSKEEVMEKLVADYPKANLVTIDGISLTFDDWRFNVRASNTEPVLRLNLEGANQKIITQKMEELTNKIISLGGKIKK